VNFLHQRGQKLSPSFALRRLDVFSIQHGTFPPSLRCLDGHKLAARPTGRDIDSESVPVFCHLRHLLIRHCDQVTRACGSHSGADSPADAYSVRNGLSDGALLAVQGAACGSARSVDLRALAPGPSRSQRTDSVRNDSSEPPENALPRSRRPALLANVITESLKDATKFIADLARFRSASRQIILRQVGHLVCVLNAHSVYHRSGGARKIEF